MKKKVDGPLIICDDDVVDDDDDDMAVVQSVYFNVTLFDVHRVSIPCVPFVFVVMLGCESITNCDGWIGWLLRLSTGSPQSVERISRTSG